MFSRKKQRDGSAATPAPAGDDASGDASAEESSGADAAAAQGPFDSSQVDDVSGYVSFGALLVPPQADISVGLEQDPATKRLVGLAVLRAGGTMQLRAFAAPRTGGYWDQNRAELLGQLQQMKGRGEEVEGEFGTEVRAVIPTPPLQGKPAQPGERHLRFVAVEGPRWLLRAAFGGNAADPATDGPIVELFRSLVVVRGEEAMPVGALLALRQPPSKETDAEAQPPSAGPSEDDLEPGARITEVR